MHKNSLLFLGWIAFFLILWVGNPFAARAQNNKELAAQMVEIGDEILSQTLAVGEAREMYLNAVSLDPENIRANYMAGITTLQAADKGAAAQYFLKVFELDPNYSYDILYKIGRAFHYDYKFDEAINYYSRYKSKLAGSQPPDDKEYATMKEVERKIYECEQGKILVEFPEEVDITNVGEAINSPFDDYAPVVNATEDLLIFTSRRQEGNLNPNVAVDNYPYEDIFFSTREQGDSVWNKARNIGDVVNTLYHDSNVGLSKDGNTLYLYKDENGGDIYVSEFVDGSWSTPKPLGPPVNSRFAETTVTLTPDGNTLFFASDRDGGYGGLDIWLTHKTKKGDWGKPENLGPEVNTEYDEDAPFIGYDGKTLYFSSQGGEGMGGFDIYRIEYDSSLQAWSPPENLGYPINTPDHDIYFVPSVDGSHAYYASARDDSYGGADIYMLNIPEVLQHQEQVKSPYLALTILVKDADGEPLDASLQLVDTASASKLFAVRKGTGEYLFAITSKEPRVYELLAVREGYQEYKEPMTLAVSGDVDEKQEKTVVLQKIQAVAPPPAPAPAPAPKPVSQAPKKKLRNIYFDFNKATIKPEYQPMVDKAVAFLKANPTAKLLLQGHTDYIGAEKYNAGLSLQRAEMVKKAIVSQGIDPARIQTEGLGASHPLASNDQEKEGRELNRRVEFRVIR